MLITSNGMMVRTPVREAKHGISIQGRSTQGVKIMDLRPGDRLVTITTFDELDKQLPLSGIDMLEEPEDIETSIDAMEDDEEPADEDTEDSEE